MNSGTDIAIQKPMVNLTAKCILLVDDYENFLMALANELRNTSNHNFRILTAENGERALKVLESGHVDLVVTDLRMPVMNGYDLIFHLKENYPSIPVIVVSSFLYPESEARLRTLGVSQCMDKYSLTVSALVEMMHRIWHSV